MQHLKQSKVIEIIECVGQDGLRELVENFAGRTLHIPVKATTKGELYRFTSKAVAEKIISEFGGETLYIPTKTVQTDFSTRNIKILEQRRSGTSIADLSWKYGLTERSIYSILRKMRLHPELHTPSQHQIAV